MEPCAAKNMPSESVARWLSTRWLRHKPGIRLYAMRSRQGDRGTVLVELPPLGEALDALCEFKCDVQLSDAMVRTYVLKANLANVPYGERYHHSGLYRTKDGGEDKATPRPQVYTVYEGEIYMKTDPKGVAARLRNFGITHGHHRVVMLVFPSPEHYGPNDMRTRIEPLKQKDTTDGDLPFKTRWAKEYNEAMPPELRKFVEESAVGSEERNMQIINDIIEAHARYLDGPARRRNIKKGPGDDAEATPDDSSSSPGDRMRPNPEDPKPRGKRKRKKGSGKPNPTNRRTRKFQPPPHRWEEPSPNDELIMYSGEYSPYANNGRGFLLLNRNWKGLKKWQERVADAKPEFTPRMVQHYTEQASLLIHIDVIMKAKFENHPDPGYDDFMSAMQLPTSRDMVLREVISHSTRVGAQIENSDS